MKQFCLRFKIVLIYLSREQLFTFLPLFKNSFLYTILLIFFLLIRIQDIVLAWCLQEAGMYKKIFRRKAKIVF